MIRVLTLKNRSESEELFRRLHVDKAGIKIMLPKTGHLLLYVDALNVPAANILKQELLSLGGDVALHKGACNFSVRETACLLMGNQAHFERLAKKLLAQPFGLKELAKHLKKTIERFYSMPAPISMGPYKLEFSKGPLIMGILNVTPDSFSGNGLDPHVAAVLKKAEQLMDQGSDILDLGGESTRPGASPVSLKEERARVIPALKALARRFKIPISVDTSKSQIAEECLEQGAHIVNDVTGLTGDPGMAQVVKKHKAPAVIMHHRFRTTRPKDPLGEICEFFLERIQSLETLGIPRERLILDPGIGFGKDANQNLFVLKHMLEFKIFGQPLLLGPSRKSFIGKIAGAETAERLSGTLASLVHAHLKGFHIFRVHDVREARQALALSQAIEESDAG